MVMKMVSDWLNCRHVQIAFPKNLKNCTVQFEYYLSDDKLVSLDFRALRSSSSVDIIFYFASDEVADYVPKVSCSRQLQEFSGCDERTNHQI